MRAIQSFLVLCSDNFDSYYVLQRCVLLGLVLFFMSMKLEFWFMCDIFSFFRYLILCLFFFLPLF